MSFNITVEGGTSVRLPTEGKYCDRDIVVTSTGGKEDLEAVLTEQEALIATLQDTLRGKAAGGGGAEAVIEPLSVTGNGTYTAPDGVDGYSPVTVNVPIPDGYIVPSGTLEVTENGTKDVTAYASVSVNVPTGGGGGGDSDLPAGYRRADYIQFAGKQIVDTGIICNQNTKIQTYFTRGSSSQEYLYGVASSGNTASVTAYLGGSWRFGNKSAAKSCGTINAKVGYAGYVDASTISVTNSVSAISGVNEFETVGSLLIGSCRSAEGDVGTAQFDGKISFFAMWEGDEQVLKLVPVTDGITYRFFDMVSQEFFDSITDTPLGGGDL